MYKLIFIFMNKKKKVLQMLLIVGVIAIGLYMFFSFAWGTPPAISGLAFVLTGLALWIPHCPLVNILFGDKK
jgi:F0F1-type ATP synthase assembly protein I